MELLYYYRRAAGEFSLSVNRELLDMFSDMCRGQIYTLIKTGPQCQEFTDEVLQLFRIWDALEELRVKDDAEKEKETEQGTETETGAGS